MTYENLLIIPIDRFDQNLLKSFDCSIQQINNFFKLNALKEHSDRLSSTYLITEENEIIIGFYTINIYSISFKNKEKKDYPYSINLAYFAIDKKYQNMGYGTELINIITLEILEIARKIGIRYFSVQALDNKKDWYIKRGFAESKKDDFNIFLIDLKKTEEEGVLNESNGT